LELFARFPGRILTRDEISQALHGRDWSPYDRTIDGHVARLRRKLEQGQTPTSVIRSVRGVGYVLDSIVSLPRAPA
jgi:DNA-binding response OmpR family regulator